MDSTSMCVIIEKQPGKVVPYEHLLAGAHRNPDGYGAVVVDRGKLEIIRGLSLKDFKQGADQVAKLLEQAKDNLAYVHYRFRTKGDVNIDNVHPFPVFKSKDCEMVFMHNGTVMGFDTGHKESDSKQLCDLIIAPLAKRCAALLGDENVCCDPLLATVLKQYAGGTYNKFVLVDNHGNSMVINRTTGVDQPYGWSSNGYSLETDQVQRYLPGFKEEEKKSYFPGLPPSTKTTKVESKSEGLSTGKALAKDNVVSLGAKLDVAKNTNKPSPRSYHPSIRQTVADLTGFDLKSFCYLDAEQVRRMVRDQPDLSAVLILDLLAIAYDDEFKTKSIG